MMGGEDGASDCFNFYEMGVGVLDALDMWTIPFPFTSLSMTSIFGFLQVYVSCLIT